MNDQTPFSNVLEPPPHALQARNNDTRRRELRLQRRSRLFETRQTTRKSTIVRFRFVSPQRQLSDNTSFDQSSLVPAPTYPLIRSTMPSPPLSLLLLPLLITPLQTLSLPPLSNTTTPLLPSIVNTSGPEPDTEDNAPSFKVTCNGQFFGRNPNLADCESAKEYVSPDTDLYTWGPRHEGLGAEVFPMPFRIMGDRGLCFFQVVLVDEQKRTARASLGQVRRAASALILQCAAGTESVGGMAKNIGGDNNLAVVLGIYQPNVQCRGTFGPEWSSCRDVLGDMPVSKTRLTFGPRNVPGVQQGLPVAIESSDDKCIMQLFSTGTTDNCSWYRMWEAMTAVFSICVRGGRGGVYMGLGEMGKIFLTASSMKTGLQIS
ncbi:hypothetical protein BDR22DRAFT_605878 [Usnea florida]